MIADRVTREYLVAANTRQLCNVVGPCGKQRIVAFRV